MTNDEDFAALEVQIAALEELARPKAEEPAPVKVKAKKEPKEVVITEPEAPAPTPEPSTAKAPEALYGMAKVKAKFLKR